MTEMDYGTELQLGHVSPGRAAVAQGILADVPEAAEQAHHWCPVYGTRGHGGEPQIKLS